MKVSRWLLLVVLAAMVSVVGVTRLIHAEAITLSDENKKNRVIAVKLGFSPPLTWAMDPWAGSDKPFTTIRTEIDKVSKEDQFSRSVLVAYREQARKNPKDPVAQFCWGYAYYKAWNDGVQLGTEVENLDTSLDIAWGLQQVPSPHSYEYTRLLFLNSAKRSMYHLGPVGRRLLRHTPEDYDVEFYFYEGLASAATPVERKEALLGAQKLIRQYPERRGAPYGVLAEVYSAQWEKGDVQSGPLAMAAYQKYLSMPPKGLTPQDRQGLEYWMNFIRTHPSGPKGPKIK